MADFSGMEVPLVHLNGTSKSDLCSQLTRAYRAVENAIDIISQIAPHGRDYYPLDGAVAGACYRKAHDEHVRRVKQLASLRDEYTHLLEAVQNQGQGR